MMGGASEPGPTGLPAAPARERFRPILMTSMAFSLGVVPLVISSGAGAAGRNAIGSGVLGGTIAGTVLGVLFVPLFYVLIRRLAPMRRAAAHPGPGGAVARGGAA